MDSIKPRKRGKDKSKNTYKKYGKYSTKSTRIKEEAILNQQKKKLQKSKN